MVYYITKTGLDAFDTARAWGLGVVLNFMTGDDVQIIDQHWAYSINPNSSVRTTQSFSNPAWTNLFQGKSWKQVFVTSIGNWENKRDEVKKVIEQEINLLLDNLQDPKNTVRFDRGESLPGGLDPSGFKGLRHATRAKYQEGQLKVPKDHWALACLGMATCGIYYRRTKSRRGQRPDEHLALLPVPYTVRFSHFRDVQELFTKGSDLQYHGVQNAAAHYAVQLAEHLRSRAAAKGSLQDCYSAVLYFTLMKPDKRTANWKPAQGNQLSLRPLMNAIKCDPHRTQFMLRWLDSCFRLGSTKGAEDLAFAATELVMRWDLDAYDRLVRVAVRILARQQVRKKNPRGFDAFLWRTRKESIQSIVEVMNHAAI